MKGSQGEFDDVADAHADQDNLEDRADCYVCPDKPLPPEPPASSNEVSEDELETNDVDEEPVVTTTTTTAAS